MAVPVIVGDAHFFRMDPQDLQEQPESTIGHKPAEFRHDEPRKEHEEQGTKRFARGHMRGEEAEESEVGAELREREVEEDSEEEEEVVRT